MIRRIRLTPGFSLSNDSAIAAAECLARSAPQTGQVRMESGEVAYHSVQVGIIYSTMKCHDSTDVGVAVHRLPDFDRFDPSYDKLQNPLSSGGMNLASESASEPR